MRFPASRSCGGTFLWDDSSPHLRYQWLVWLAKKMIMSSCLLQEGDGSVSRTACQVRRIRRGRILVNRFSFAIANFWQQSMMFNSSHKLNFLGRALKTRVECKRSETYPCNGGDFSRRTLWEFKKPTRSHESSQSYDPFSSKTWVLRTKGYRKFVAVQYQHSIIAWLERSRGRYSINWEAVHWS